MKNNSTVILGYLGFIGSLSYSLYFIYEFSDSPSGEDILALFGFLATLFCSMIYLIKTKFWMKSTSIENELEIENKILKKKIEQAELKNRLKELEK